MPSAGPLESALQKASASELYRISRQLLSFHKLPGFRFTVVLDDIYNLSFRNVPTSDSHVIKSGLIVAATLEALA